MQFSVMLTHRFLMLYGPKDRFVCRCVVIENEMNGKKIAKDGRSIKTLF